MNILSERPSSSSGGQSDLRWLFLDMNSFFASCEQQMNPSLRARPIAVVPMKADTTCVIAASYEAKRHGVKTGTIVKEARSLCPGIVFIPARPKAYVEYHHRFLDAVEKCVPIEDVLSIDEVACRLDRTQRTLDEVRNLSRRIKTMMYEDVGECLTCSIGVASNKLLAKLASDMKKPDGLTILRSQDLPQAILHLTPGAISGIGPRMEARLAAHGLSSMQDLWNADISLLRRVWGGALGARFHALLHGEDLPSPVHTRRSIGRQHVLSPGQRTLVAAEPVVRQLLARAATRLRHEGFYARRLILDLKWQGRLGSYVEETRFNETQDTGFFLQVLRKMWRRLPEGRPLRIGVTLADLAAGQRHQPDLFERARSESLTKAVDALNAKFGAGAVSYGFCGEKLTSKIAFNHVPEMRDFY